MRQRFMGLLRSKGIFAFEARSNTNNGTNVLTFVDLIDPTRILTLSGASVAVPVPSANFGGSLVCTFSGSTGTCNKAASTFRALHDGTGVEVRQLLRTSSTGQQVTLDTRPAGVGVTMLLSAGRANIYILNTDPYPAGAVINETSMTLPINTTAAFDYRYFEGASPNFTGHATGVSDAVADTVLVPYAGDPSGTLRLFSDGANFFAGQWFGSYAFRTLTTSERALLNAYTTSVTGIASP